MPGILFGIVLIKLLMRRIYICSLAMLVSLTCLGKEISEKVDLPIDNEKQNAFFESPFVWIGIAIFLLLFRAITRGQALR